MGSIIYFNGMRIEVPTRELAEALRQVSLVRSLEGLPPAPVQTSMDLGMPTAPKPTAPAPTPSPMGPSTGNANKDLALNFLRVIADHELSGGAPISAVMFALGASKEQGVGSKAAVVNRVLDSAGFAIPDVYSNDRDAHGDRYWKAGPRLRDAMNALSGETPGKGAEHEN